MDCIKIDIDKLMSEMPSNVLDNLFNYYSNCVYYKFTKYELKYAIKIFLQEKIKITSVDYEDLYLSSVLKGWDYNLLRDTHPREYILDILEDTLDNN